MKLKQLVKALESYFFPDIGLAALPAIEYDGNSANNGSLQQVLSVIQQVSSPATGYQNYKSIATSSTVTLNAATLPGGIAGATVAMTGSTATALTFDKTDVIMAAIPGAYIGMTFPFNVANVSSATQTATVGDANTTLAGTTTVTAVSFRAYQGKVTNLAVPGAPGAASTNSTTTTAAVAAQVPSTTVTTTVIPVTASTGMLAAGSGGSVLQVVQTDGTLFTGAVSAINSLNITVSAVNTKAIASGAAVTVWNPTITITGMFAIDHATGVIA